MDQKNDKSDLECLGNDEIPRHIAIVMDGNGRWAKKRFLPRTSGHQAGVRMVHKVLERCGQRGVEVVTLFAFSSENWHRPQEEVSALMSLFVSTLEQQTEALHEKGVRLRFIGDRSAFNRKLQSEIVASEQKTRDNTRLTLVIAVNYGGRWDILEATRMIARKVEQGKLSVADLSQETIENQLAFPDLPEPDLFIRTGGEVRISNFLLWQLAYTELYFSDTLWPDFDGNCLDLAIEAYAGRQRRYGRTSVQIAAGAKVPVAL